ncbi:MAG: hypothetical protein MJ001_02945 [Paludibacteraceae bacterium]|nr:hypothetical protein [Paludibacteraceae bacterium]
MNSDYQDMSLFDFIVLCVKKLKAFFVWLFRVLLNMICTSLKYWYVIVVFMVLGVLYARYCTKPQMATFKGEATIVFPSTLKPVIESGLQFFVKDNAQEKGLKEEESAALTAINIYNVIDARGDGSVDFTDKKSTVLAIDSAQFVMMDRLTIELQANNESYFPAYEKALCEYFNSKEEYSMPAKRWRESVERKIAYINRQVENADSFNINAFDMREALTESLAATPDVINFQTHFLISSESVPHSKLRYIFSVLAAFVLGLILSYIIEYRKDIRKHLQIKR